MRRLTELNPHPNVAQPPRTPTRRLLVLAESASTAITPRAPRLSPGQGHEVSCRLQREGPDLAVVLLNSSADGVGLLVSAPLTRGDEVFIDFSEPGLPRVRRTGTVRWCRHVYESYYRVGIQLKSLTGAEVTDLPTVAVTAPTAMPSSPQAQPIAPVQVTTSRSDRRAADRSPAKGSTRVRCRKGRTGIGSDIALSVMDVSRTGVRLMVSCRLHPGDAVLLRFATRGDPLTVQRIGTVRWCVKTDWSYCTGIELETPLAEADIQLFI